MKGQVVLATTVAIIAFGPMTTDRAAADHPASGEIHQVSERSYVVVDTGQLTCYDDRRETSCPTVGAAFHGQDAQHVGTAPQYVDNGDGTVADTNTGLTWQKTPGDKVTFDQALAGAEALELAGYDDWRLPSIKELYSLIDFSGVDPSGWNGTDTSGLSPFIDTDYFDFEFGDTSAGERVIDSQYWSSTEYVGTTMNNNSTVFGVNFADGRIKGYPRDRGGRGAPTQFVRYVRGNPEYGVNRFVDNGDGTVTDGATGLQWMTDDSTIGLNWKDALDYAATLEHAGFDDWRLPDAKELQSIVDYSRSPATHGSAAIDGVFHATPFVDESGTEGFATYWTSTTHVNMSARPGTQGVYLAFGEALGFMEMPPDSGNRQLLDVHGAGAQRSDPKSGDPGDYPFGRGPQGDVVRIYNFARGVRDADGVEPTAVPTTEPTTEPTAVIPTSTPTRLVAPSHTPVATVEPTTASPRYQAYLPFLFRQ